MTDQDSRPFAEALRDRRRQLRLSQAEAAAAIGASEKSWRRWEKGQPVDGRFRDAIRERFGIGYAQIEPPQAVAARGVAEVERVLSEIREALERATNVHADVVLQRPDGATAMVEVKAFHSGLAGELEREVVAFVASAAQDAGWTVHIAR